MKNALLAAILFLGTTCGVAQEGLLHSEFRKEFGALGGQCFHASFKQFGGCAETLVMGKPLHVAVGSIAPQNGFAAGLAFTHERNFTNGWTFKVNSDAVVSTNQSWRAGLYLKAIPKQWQWTGDRKAIFNFYSQGITLNKIFYFGPGPLSSTANRTFYGMQQTISGANAVIPTPSPFSFYGEIHLRTVDIRGRHGDISPSIEQLFSEANTPGLTTQPTFLQFGERIRFKPKLPRGIRLDYSAMLQHFHAVSDSRFSFRRFTLDFNHEIPLYQKQAASAGDSESSVGPDEIRDKPAGLPEIKSFTTNTVGSIGLRALIVGSAANAGSAVPFYFQPTIGGTDINGDHSLASYQDYRFRAPNLFLLRATVEHSLFWVLGLTAQADVGKVAANRSDIDFSHLRHTYSAGLSLRAGNLPQVSLMFAWAGKEGRHTTAYINPALLGGNPRPSLY
jgi:hypothetical protein